MNEPLKHHEQQEVQPSKMEEMKRVVAQNEAYQKLKAFWSDDEVTKYVTYIADEAAEEMLAGIASESIDWIATDFHERFEMTVLENIIDGREGKGVYRDAIQTGKLDKYDVIDTGEITVVSPLIHRKKLFFPYFEAHPQAMRAEMEFLQQTAKELGIEISPLAFFAARPVNWEDFDGTDKTVKEFYLLQRKQNLRIENDEPDGVYPIELPTGFAEELAKAQQFFLDYGAKYAVLPTDIMKKNGLEL